MSFATIGCTKQYYASDDMVRKAAYIAKTPPSITLLTMINNKTGAGGHSSLLINASQRIIYDPAGRWYSSVVPERADVLFGITPKVLKRYKSFHSRETHHVVSQRIIVSPKIAEIAYRVALDQGNSLDAMCAQNTSQILHKLPGFEAINTTWFPRNLMKQFAQLPDVVTSRYYETDIGKN